MFVAANSYAGNRSTQFAVVRYGNVMGSRGSVIPFFTALPDDAPVPITDERMTRFMITLDQGVELVWHAFRDMVGGEIYVKKIPSMQITKLAEAVLPGRPHEIVGVRPGEKLHEQMIGLEDAPTTYEYEQHFKILPAINGWGADRARIKNGVKVASDFIYSSDTNSEWMAAHELQDWLRSNQSIIGKI